MATSLIDQVFLRHAHPVSAWSRWASTPLVVVPLWSRRAWTALPVAAWMIVNPVVTPPPADDGAFATRAILGERQWLTSPGEHHDVLALNALGTVCLALAGVAAWRRRALPTVVALAAAMGVILATWRSYAGIYDRAARPPDRLGRRPSEAGVSGRSRTRR